MVVHGGDFIALGAPDALDESEHATKQHFELKTKGRLGLDEGGVRDMRVLNRVLKLQEGKPLYGPDLRNARLFINAFELGGGNFAVTPGLTPNTIEDENPHRKLEG